MKVTAVNDVIEAIVSVLNAAGLGFKIYDGSIGKQYSDMSYLVVGGEDIDSEQDAADMQQEWHGLGAKSRLEEMNIYCTAVGRAHSPSAARIAALAVVEQAGEHLPQKPTAQSYNALIASVDRIRASITQAGVTVRVSFTINAKARLI